MTTYFAVTTTTTPGVPFVGLPFPSIETALCSVKPLLGDGAVTVYIIDRDGNLVLPIRP